MVIFFRIKCLNRNLPNFYKYGRHFSTKNCYVRSKMGTQKYITCERELNVEGYRRFINMRNLTSVNILFSEMKYFSFIASTKFPGQYKTSNIKSSFPTVCMIMGSRSFVSGEHTWTYQKNVNDSEKNINEHEEVEDFEEEEYDDMFRRLLHLPEMGHQVLVVQPYIKWGSAKKRNTTPELQLAEAVALVGTLPKWKVVDKVSDTSTWPLCSF